MNVYTILWMVLFVFCLISPFENEIYASVLQIWYLSLFFFAPKMWKVERLQSRCFLDSTSWAWSCTALVKCTICKVHDRSTCALNFSSLSFNMHFYLRTVHSVRLARMPLHALKYDHSQMLWMRVNKDVSHAISMCSIMNSDWFKLQLRWFLTIAVQLILTFKHIQAFANANDNACAKNVLFGSIVRMVIWKQDRIKKR